MREDLYELDVLYRHAKRTTTWIEMARQTGIDPASIPRMLTKQSNPKLRNLIKIANALNYDINLEPRKRG